MRIVVLRNDHGAVNFHLSLSVSNLVISGDFYVHVLEAIISRETESWCDVWLFGSQVTLVKRPKAMLPNPFQQALHFGATLDWAHWLEIKTKLENAEVKFASAPLVNDDVGVAKLMLSDPDGYLIELKAYQNPNVQLQNPYLSDSISD